MSRAAGEDVGEYTITPAGAATQGNYTVTYETGTFTITPAAVTVKANDADKVYGTTDPAEFTATVEGLVGEDTIEYTVSRAAGEDVGEYTITPAGDAAQGNYMVTYETGTFTITPGGVTVKANDDGQGYDRRATDPAEFTATVEGLVGEDTIEYTVSRAAGEDVGEYTITPAGAATQGNYTVTYETGTFTITPEGCDGEGERRGQGIRTTTRRIRANTATVTGLVGEDTIEYTVSRAAGEDVGEYTITPAGAATQGNYTVTYETGTFTITPKAWR